jgi:hypothetical protein
VQGIKIMDIKYGWRCPVCLRVYSPETKDCTYCNDKLNKSKSAKKSEEVIDGNSKSSSQSEVQG